MTEPRTNGQWRMEVKKRDRRIAELEQENAQLREGRCPRDGNTWDEHFDIGYAKGLEDDRDEQAEIDQVHARLLCEALGEEYEPRNRDEWRRTFAEMLPLVKARSDAWRTLLTRVEEADPEWLAAWRAALAFGEHSRHKVERRLVTVDTPLSMAGWPSPTCTCPGPYTKDLDCPVHGGGQPCQLTTHARCRHPQPQVSTYNVLDASEGRNPWHRREGGHG